MNYDEWEKTVPEAIKGDSLWKMAAYRLAVFLGDLGWHDVTRLVQDRRTIDLSSQLYEALGSMSANLAEGYSRGSGKDRARFYEYALGSARESRDWYFEGRHILGEIVVQHRLQLLAEILRLLLTMVPQQRGRSLREENIPYRIEADNDGWDTSINEEVLNALLQNVPLPDL
ncbi:MAG TPA: four helix bundle protein [Anaerolineae bacterium]|nr:four helix bundle protein [Anaerolineae bacterium]